MYSVKGKEYDEHSKVNRAVMDRFVRSVVHADLTSIVEYILSLCDETAPFSILDLGGDGEYCCPECGSAGVEQRPVSELLVNFENGYICPICGEGHETRSMAQHCCMNGPFFWQCPDCGTVYASEDDMETMETMEYNWFLVDQFVADEMEKNGEPVLRTETCNIWGADPDLNMKNLGAYAPLIGLAKKCEILEGQKNSWV